MMQTLGEQFKTISNNFRVEHEVKERIRDNLMYQVENYERKAKIEYEDAKNYWKSFRVIKLAWQPVGIAAMVIALVLGGSGAILAQSQKAHPGDNLFVVKKAIESVEAMTQMNTVSKTVFAGRILDRRLSELEAVASRKSQLVSTGQQAKSSDVILAVSEVKKQVKDVDQKFKKMRDKAKESEGEIALAALDLNKKMRVYYKELQAVKDNVEDKRVGDEIDGTLDKVEDIKSEALAVIVDKYKGNTGGVPEKEVADSLEEHVAIIRDKVDKAVENIGTMDKETVDKKMLAVKAGKAKESIAKAAEALKKNEYSLVLTLANNSNEILKMLYGDVNSIQNGVVKDSQIEAPPENRPTSTEVIVKDEQKTKEKIDGKQQRGDNGTTPAVAETNIKTTEDSSVATGEKAATTETKAVKDKAEENQEFEVGIN